MLVWAELWCVGIWWEKVVHFVTSLSSHGVLTSHRFLSCFLPSAGETLGLVIHGAGIVVYINRDWWPSWWQDRCSLFMWRHVPGWDSLDRVLTCISLTFNWHSWRYHWHVGDRSQRPLSTIFPYLRTFIILSNRFLWVLLQVFENFFAIFFLLRPLENIEWTLCILKTLKLSAICISKFSFLSSLAFTSEAGIRSRPYSFVIISDTDRFARSVWSST